MLFNRHSYYLAAKNADPIKACCLSTATSIYAMMRASSWIHWIPNIGWFLHISNCVRIIWWWLYRVSLLRFQCSQFVRETLFGLALEEDLPVVPCHIVSEVIQARAVPQLRCMLHIDIIYSYIGMLHWGIEASTRMRSQPNKWHTIFANFCLTWWLSLYICTIKWKKIKN